MEGNERLMNSTEFEHNLKKYAHLLITKGINVLKDDFVLINADIDQAPLVRLMTEEAYRQGAYKVIVKWSDDQLARLNLTYQSKEALEDIPQYLLDESEYMIEKRMKRVALRSSDPNAFNGVDADKISTSQLAQSKAFQPLRIASQANVMSWLVCAGASPEWAALVFPKLKTQKEQVDALWDAIFKATRIYADDPIQAWQDHENLLKEKADYLNNQQFDALHFTSGETDLTIGLPVNHVWESATSQNQQGEDFIANMPTEEVFTAPDFRRIDGTVVSSKPLSYAGQIIDGMTFEFEKGQIVKATAQTGEEALLKLIEENEGAKSLGEVALVPHQSPISQSNLTFYNTLFDENASNHLALGSAYATSIQNGAQMTQDELEAAGLNRSHIHVDFMIGNATMDIDGIKQDGSRYPIFRQGEWAF